MQFDPKYLQPGNIFSEVRCITDKDSWEEIHAKVPAVPRGWYELSFISNEDKVQFVCDFWRKKIPYFPHIDADIGVFFAQVEQLSFYVVQEKESGLWKGFLVYFMKDSGRFFLGAPPLEGKEKRSSIEGALSVVLPEEFWAFLSVHDGFSKNGEKGLFSSDTLFQEIERLRTKISLSTPSFLGEILQPEDLIPFYESELRGGVQCFYRNWYPIQEMGNIFIETAPPENENEEEILAFPTFLDWLMFYLLSNTINL